MAARTESPASEPARARRGRGRPVSAEAGVGREGLIAAARKLLRELPPSKVTASRIAQEAGADPALIRYYFGDRTTLLMTVVEEIVTERRRPPPSGGEDARELLRQRVHRAVDFIRQAQSMQRLMIDELAEAKSPAVRERVRELNEGAVGYMASLLDPRRPNALKPVDPLFLHLAIIGLCEFFVAAQPIVRPLAPPGADMDELADRYEAFVADLILQGLESR